MRIFVIAVAVLLVAQSAPLSAASRNCKPDERQRANERLMKVAGDAKLQDALIKWHLRLGTPQSTGTVDNERLLVQGGYVMSHDDDLRTTLWVGYRLTAKDQIDAAGEGRVNCFRTDPRIEAAKTGAKSDYKEDIYDQGHMANDADMKDDLIEQINSYVMSNMSPQHCRFNRGIWLSLEYLGRKWASEYDTVFILSGAIFDRDGNGTRDADSGALRMASRNGKSRVGVPSHYYKTFVRRDDDGYKSISFLLKHDNEVHGRKWNLVKPHVVGSIVKMADIESAAGLKLYPALDRSKLTESVSGDGWVLDRVSSNLEVRANSNDKCVK